MFFQISVVFFGFFKWEMAICFCYKFYRGLRGVFLAVLILCGV